MKSLSDYNELERTRLLCGKEQRHTPIGKKPKYFMPVLKKLTKDIGTDKYENELRVFINHTTLTIRYNGFASTGYLFSLNEKHYTAANERYKALKRPVCDRRMKALLLKLEELGYINFYLGIAHADPSRRCPTVIEFTDQVFELFDTDKCVKYGPNREEYFENTLVVDMVKSTVEKTYSRDGSVIKDKNRVFRDTRNIRGIKDVRSFVDAVQQVWDNNEVSVLLPGDVSPTAINTTCLYRMFEGNLTSCGRWYWGADQTLKSMYRKGILINGNPTVEIDYANCQPRMIATMAGVVLDQGYDVYAVPGLSREFCKALLFGILFSSGRSGTLSSIARKVKDFKAKGEETPDMTNKEILDAVFAVNPWLEEYSHNKMFYQELQNRDSRMVEYVLNHFCVKKGIMVLPYHDSFVIEAEHAEELKQVMIEAWEHVMGTSDNCVPRLEEKAKGFKAKRPMMYSKPTSEQSVVEEAEVIIPEEDHSVLEEEEEEEEQVCLDIEYDEPVRRRRRSYQYEEEDLSDIPEDPFG